MPRRARRESTTNIYHVMLRGINRQNIFQDREDNAKYLWTVGKIKEASGFDLYAYCLMPNHIHLLLKVGSEPLAHIMKRLGASYVYWYNQKYERCGHLFQDRFKSEPVEDDRYLLTVTRYIHQNPVKAGLTADLAGYQWSSYNDYLHKYRPLIDRTFILSLFDSNPTKALQAFKQFNQEKNSDFCLDYDEDQGPNPYIADQEVVGFIQTIGGLEKPNQLKEIDKKKRNTLLIELLGRGAKIRQLARITGISRGTIASLKLKIKVKN